MPTTATNATSLPDRRPVVNTPIQITATRQRCDYRREVVYDTRLSPGARLLYVALDDFAGIKAEAWPKQQTLADLLGVSYRSIQEWLYELVREEYVHRIRGIRGARNTYRLAWDDAQRDVPTERTERTPGCADYAHQGVHNERPSINKPGKEPGQQQQARTSEKIPVVCCSTFPEWEDLLHEAFSVLNSV